MDDFKYRLQIFSEDTDTFGIVHHANYIKFMERARLAMWLMKFGFRLDELFAKGIFFVIKKIEIDYINAARLYDELEIVTRVVSMRKVSKVYEQIIYSATKPQIEYCKAMITIVCVNHKMRPQAMPREVMEVMNDN